MEEQAKPGEKLTFDLSTVDQHINELTKLIPKLQSQLDQSRGTLSYLRQLKSKYVLPNPKQEK